MADIRTTTEELAISGSVYPDTKDVLESNPTVEEELWHESIRFLRQKIDELVDEVNTLKND